MFRPLVFWAHAPAWKLPGVRPWSPQQQGQPLPRTAMPRQELLYLALAPLLSAAALSGASFRRCASTPPVSPRRAATPPLTSCTWPSGSRSPSRFLVDWRREWSRPLPPLATPDSPPESLLVPKILRPRLVDVLPSAQVVEQLHLPATSLTRDTAAAHAPPGIVRRNARLQLTGSTPPCPRTSPAASCASCARSFLAEAMPETCSECS